MRDVLTIIIIPAALWRTTVVLNAVFFIFRAVDLHAVLFRLGRRLNHARWGGLLWCGRAAAPTLAIAVCDMA